MRKTSSAETPMRLFIAEKPSLARAIADGLPGPQRHTKTHIVCGGGNVVAWCAGHILETAPPEAYGSGYKHWRLGDLPMIPREWQLDVLRPDLLREIKALLKRAARVVHAGDPDREGQLLVDEVLDFLDYEGPVDRLLVRDLRPEAVRRQLAVLEPNGKYRPLSDAALARQRADWLYGINMTRLYTLLGRAAGYDGVLSVGRVQTPLLGLIVARDRAVAEFKPVPYYVVRAAIRTAGGEMFRARWVPAAGLAGGAVQHFDDERRLLSRTVAESICRRMDGQQGVVSTRTEEKKSEPPPLPHSLAGLQVDAGRRLGMSAQAVLDACQSLYETHRLVTYPRSDCSHLPEGQHAQAHDVVAAIVARVPSLAAAAAGANLSFRSKAWNDKKVTAHHAIIPTPHAGAAAAHLTAPELAVYEIVCRRYLAQFYPAHETLRTKVEIDIGGERFVATGRQVLAVGWRALGASSSSDDPGGSLDDDRVKESDGDRDAALPRLAKGDRMTVTEASIEDKQTEPPKPFTDASLVTAMCAVARYVTRPHIQKILTESDGIGTPATRAAIIETLFERGYVTRIQKTIVSTETGRALIRALPEVATTPDMTALWELGMRAITDREQSLSTFLERIEAELEQLVQHGKALGRVSVATSARGAQPNGRRTESAIHRPARHARHTAGRQPAE
ncbi:MAG: DNA topoisomerase 3 [Polyangiaceae bacterium]